jgi:hypothetical protein
MRRRLFVAFAALFFLCSQPQAQIVSQGASNSGTVTAIAGLTCIIDGQGSAISASAASYCVLSIPFSCTVVSATLTADQSGSIVVDIWTNPFGSGVPTSNASSIAASDLPTLSSAQTYQDTTLTGWTTAVAANTLMLFHVNAGASTVQRVTATIGCSVTL